MRIKLHAVQPHTLSAELRIAHGTLLSKSVQKKSTDYKGKWTDYTGKMDNSTQQTYQELYNLFVFKTMSVPNPRFIK